MRKITVFNHVSLDGFFCDMNGGMSWAHKQDAESTAFASENAKGGGMLMFGRVTYQMMASFWPTPMAAQSMPIVAEHMNALPKIVFSRTLDEVSWNNARLIKTDIIEAVRTLKGEDGDNIGILGSGTIVSQLAEHELIDSLGLMVNPVVLGRGRTLFETVTKQLNFKQTNTRTFANGNIYLSYEPA